MTRHQLAIQISQLFSSFDESSAAHTCMHTWGLMHNHSVVSIRTMTKRPVLWLAGAYIDLVHTIVQHEIVESWYGTEESLGHISWLEIDFGDFLKLPGVSIAYLTRALADSERALLGEGSYRDTVGTDHHLNVMAVLTRLRSLLATAGFVL
jgi:hypothetical protein